MNRNRVAKWVEIFWPWIAAAAAGLLALRFQEGLVFSYEVQIRVLEKLADFSSIGVGFWATALTLLLALEGRETVAGLKKLDIYARVVGFFLWTVYAFFALLVLCMLTIAFGRPPWVPRSLSIGIWAFLLIFTGSSMLRSFRLLGKLLRSK
jgi:hypothetical protein